MKRKILLGVLGLALAGSGCSNCLNEEDQKNVSPEPAKPVTTMPFRGGLRSRPLQLNPANPANSDADGGEARDAEGDAASD